MSKARVYLILLIVGTAFWGISFSVVKIGVGSGSPFVFLAWKFAAAALVLALIFPARMVRIRRSAIVAGVLMGCPLMLGNVFQTIGLQQTSVTNSAFITGLDVLIIPLAKWALTGRPAPGRVWVAAGVALTGLYLIVTKDGLDLNAGDLWTMGGAACFAAYVLTVGRVAHRHDPIQTVTVALAISALGCALAGQFDPRAIWFSADTRYWQGVVFVALFATAFIYAIQSAAQRYLPEEKVALTYLCEPVFAAMAGFALLGEEPSARTLAGAGLILAAMILAELELKPLQRRYGSRHKRGA